MTVDPSRNKTMQGRRIESPFAANGAKPGDYYLYPEHGWCGVAPNGNPVGLRNHAVTEHEDGTISVAPSILAYANVEHPEWHGHLEHGVWREC